MMITFQRLIIFNTILIDMLTLKRMLSTYEIKIFAN